MTTERDADAGLDETGPELVLGPMLRYVDETSATVWVETDRECQVEILGRTAPTFEVSGHHYGLVLIDGLPPGSETEYRVALDGVVRWPLPDSEFPPSVLRTLNRERPVRLAFGSCRVAEIAPWNLSRRAREQAAKEQAAAGTCALNAEAATLIGVPRDRWPDTLLMIGDQVYGDEPGPATREFMAAHRKRADAGAVPDSTGTPDSTVAPDNEVADFEEYCALYREAWSQPAVRWLFSVIPTAMIFDDHDVHDDWNTSAQWRKEVTAKPWWGTRIESAFQSYWVYQHLGNLSPADLAGDDTWGKVRQQGDAAPVLADLARRADERAPGVRFSFARTFGGDRVRVIMLDSRGRRVVDGTRLIVDDAEWQWCTEAVAGDWEHVVLATSVPPLLPRGIHALEAWNERVSGGAWGSRAARFGERQRQALDLEHWPAFGESFIRLERLLGEIATGQRSPAGRPPASVTIISGDIHHSYLAAVHLPKRIAGAPPAGTGGAGARSAVYEAVCSPFHQAMPPKMITAQKIASSRLGGIIGTAISSLAGAHIPKLTWRITEGPWFENMIAVLEYNGATAGVRFDRARGGGTGAPRLELARASRLT
ncbi:MAG TPA: alkaline phosphatase D family protein [Trebonia sp.]|nr:alkaline phosphatase D family protein [Trebonia sp.]